MPLFNYRGRDAGGNLKSGQRLAKSADMLSQSLFQEGIIPVSISPVSTAVSLWQTLQDKISNKIPLDELAIFARQMYLLAKTGVSLTHAMRRLAENTEHKSLAKALFGMVEKLEGGQDLASSMEEYPTIFSPLMISMVRVGQSSGRLDDAFLRISQFIELEASVLKDMKTAMRYPMFVIIALISAVVIVNIFVIPAFAKVFEQAHMDLPLPTLILVGMSNFFVHHWLFMIISVVIITLSVRYYIHTPKGQFLWSKYQLRMPIFGSLIKRLIILRFIQSFAITVNSGVPLIEGIGLLAQSIDNEYIRKQIASMRESIEHGHNLTQAAATTDLFTPLELQILTVSEETGELGVMLEQIATFNKREIEYDIKRLSDLIEPLLIMALAGMVLLLALAVYLPIWNMVRLAHH